MRELFDVKPVFISLVSAGANRRTFKIFKSADYKEEEKDKDLMSKVKEIVKNLFKKEGITMLNEDQKREAELAAQKKAKAEEDRVKAEKDAKEKEEKEKADKELKSRVAEAVASILQDKENLEELKGLIAKVEKGEKPKPEEVIKLKEALGVKTEEKPKEEEGTSKEIKNLKARIQRVEEIKGIKKSVTGQDGGQGEKKWPSFSA